MSFVQSLFQHIHYEPNLHAPVRCAIHQVSIHHLEAQYEEVHLYCFFSDKRYNYEVLVRIGWSSTTPFQELPHCSFLGANLTFIYF